MRRRPKLIVFDLDLTLWPFRVDKHTKPPFCRDESGNIFDTTNKKIELYPDVPQLLEKLQKEGYTLGVASRIEHVEGANQLLDLFGLSRYFKYKEIYPGSKVAHFEKVYAVWKSKRVDMPWSSQHVFQGWLPDIHMVNALALGENGSQNFDKYCGDTLNTRRSKLGSWEPNYNCDESRCADYVLQNEKQFKEDSGLDYSHMLFFDDDKRNIRDISRKGVTAIQVPDGINPTIVDKALSEFSSMEEEMSDVTS